MTARVLAGVLLAVAAISLVRPSSGQVQSVPGPGSGVVTVTGTVGVDNVVRVVPGAGEWKVAVSNTPDVRVANTPTVALSPLPFVKIGGRYDVIWSPNERELIHVTAAGSGGWIRVESSGRARWVNLSLARSVEEAR